MSIKLKIGGASFWGAVIWLQIGCTAPRKPYPQLWRENPAFHHGQFQASDEPGAVMIGEAGPVYKTSLPPTLMHQKTLGGYPPGVRYYSPSGRDVPPVVKTPPRERPPEDLPEGEELGASVLKPGLEPSANELRQLSPEQNLDTGSGEANDKDFYEDLFEPKAIRPMLEKTPATVDTPCTDPTLSHNDVLEDDVNLEEQPDR